MEQIKTIEERLIKIEALLLSQKSVLNLEEVSDYTGLSKSYLYKLTSKAEIPHYKPHGKYMYFEKSEIDQWLLKNRIKTVKELQSETSTIITTVKVNGL